MTKKGLTITMVVLAESANYTEGLGNISVLKKMSRGDRNQYTYISRQALRYNIVQQAEWDNTPVSEAQTVVQFDPAATIIDYPEIDLFGYMKTMSKDDKGKGGAATRSAVARLSNAIALEPYNGDMDYLTNMGLAKRGGYSNAIAQSEINYSFYSYTISIDLDRVGVDGDIEIPPEEKAKRVNTLLETIQFLYRDIKGRRENLAPVFVIGGVYDRKNPFFENRISVNDGELDVEKIKEVMNGSDDIRKNTMSGVISGTFINDVKTALGCGDIASVFEALKGKVSEYYG